MADSYEILDGAPLPVYSWAVGLEEGAAQQARNCAALPVAHHHVAVMADGHVGYGVPIGAVVALQDAISPYAVGNDIGCGMAIIPTTITKTEMLAQRDDIMGWVQSTVPSGNAGHKDPVDDAAVARVLDDAYDALAEIGFDKTRDEFVDRGRKQLGSLGSGNHFFELLVGEDDDVWVMVHSGSRGVGSAICNAFHQTALAYCDEEGITLADPGLAWLPMDERGRRYERAMQAGLVFAQANRSHILSIAARTIEHRFPGSLRWDEAINIHHNDAVLEHHFDAGVWVHRKGAVKAGDGTPTITPGSMGTATWVGEGRGNALSFESCSHGAGRTRSRGKARKELSLQDELDAIRQVGGKVFAQNKNAVLDEMPGAYKDVDAVMRSQAALVSATRRLTPLATYKGV